MLDRKYKKVISTPVFILSKISRYQVGIIPDFWQMSLSGSLPLLIEAYFCVFLCYFQSLSSKFGTEEIKNNIFFLFTLINYLFSLIKASWTKFKIVLKSIFDIFQCNKICSVISIAQTILRISGWFLKYFLFVQQGVAFNPLLLLTIRCTKCHPGCCKLVLLVQEYTNYFLYLVQTARSRCEKWKLYLDFL